MFSTAFANDPGVAPSDAPAFMQADNVRSFWAHVRSLAPAKEILRIADFDLMEVHRLAPDMIVCDFDYESCRHRLRFVGTRVVDVFGEDTTGKYLDEINFGPYRSQQLAAFSMAAASGLAQWTRLCVQPKQPGVVERLRKPGATCERLVVPMADRDGAVRQLAAVMEYNNTSCEGAEFEHRELAPETS